MNMKINFQVDLSTAVFNASKVKGNRQYLPIKVLKVGCCGDCDSCKRKWTQVLTSLSKIN